ncbi:MAG: hypothetical protein ACI9RM_002439 [Ulvibacter sp.]|jgi:hypothetical protein
MKLKAILTYLCLFFFANTTYSQIIDIPDDNFKAALLSNSAINTNGDNEIQESEAEAFTDTLNVEERGILDLEGIAFFTNLTYLKCTLNYLTSLDLSYNTALTNISYGKTSLTNLDLSANIALTSISCEYMNLTHLDVSANTELAILNCNQTDLNSLDLSANKKLAILNCSYTDLASLDLCANKNLFHLKCDSTQLSSLDLSANTTLNSLDCSNNNLTSLNLKNGNNDISNNTNTNLDKWNFNAKGNPNLSCIEVDSESYAVANWTSIDPASSFSEDCSFDNVTKVYPNPTTGLFTVELQSCQDVSVSLYNLSGQVLYQQEFMNRITQVLDISWAAIGVYVIEVVVGGERVHQQLVVKR